jgi:hypothetical protein
VRVPPTLWEDKALLGSADGYVYCLHAGTGRLLWRFRAAPAQRKIMVFGKLCSTWPVNSGVLVDKGLACAAAGIINYDGTHVYALDARTGKIKWQNNASGHLDGELREGVSAQGDIAVLGGRLLLAGGNVASPGVYSLADGKCLNGAPAAGGPGACSGSMVCALLDKYPMVGGRRLFTQDDDLITNWRTFVVYDPANPGQRLAAGLDGRVAPAFGHGAVAALQMAQGQPSTCVNRPLACYDADKIEQWIKAPRPASRPASSPKAEARWIADSIREVYSLALAPNAVLAAGRDAQTEKWTLQALDLPGGKPMWSLPLPAAPAPNGLCVDASGRAIVVLSDGRIFCAGEK